MNFLAFLSFCRPSDRSEALVDLIFVFSVKKYIGNNMSYVELVTKILKYIKTLFFQNMVKQVNLDFCSYFHVARLLKTFDSYFDFIFVFSIKKHIETHSHLSFFMPLNHSNALFDLRIVFSIDKYFAKMYIYMLKMVRTTYTTAYER